jgi:hypothetical protein
LQNSRKDVAALIWEQHREEILKDTAFVQKIAQEVAEQFWMERKTHIMSDLDLKGLANLIAVYAAKEFKA